MMEFTFTDYTFSGLLSILAALYGVGYPLIIQSIGKISSQYNSDNISDRFTKETIYVIFQALLILNMAFAIATPFLLHAGWHNVLFLVLQAVLLMLLVGQTFLLFNLILKYSSAPKLLKHIEGKQVDKSNIYQIFDLAVYADANHLYTLYIDCMADVFGYIHVQQGDKPNQDLNLVLPPAKYDPITFDITRKIKGFLREDDGHHYLYRQNDIVSAFFNYLSRSRLSAQSRQIMWSMVNEAIAYNNKDWFSQYWQYADSYASFKYHYIRHDQGVLEEDKAEFLAMHVMVGTSLMHWKRYGWINDVFFYTHSEPEYYGLIPSSFSQIIVTLRKLARRCDNPIVGWPYYFNDSMAGATDEKHIFRESVRYFALLVIRLWTLKGRNLMEHGHIFDTPAFSLLLTDEEQEINLLGMMVKDVKEWISMGVFSQMLNLTTVDEKTVVDFIEAYKGECEMDLQNRRNHPTVNRTEYEELHKQFEDEVYRLFQILPNEDSYQSGLNLSTELRKKDAVETINYSGYVQIDCRCVSSVICTNFWNEIACAYLRFLDRQKRIGDFKVPRKQIGNVLKEMGLGESYAIIATETMEEIENAKVVLQVLLNVKWFFVVLEDEMPKTKLQAVDDLPELKGGTGICSNLEEFQACNNPQFELMLATRFSFSIPNSFTGYVRFTVDEDPAAQDAQIVPKQTFDELFHKK